MNITQAFIFCAGRGERMMPLTATTPKPLLEVRGKKMLDHILEKLATISSLKKIIINAYYLADEIENHLKSLNNPKIILSREHNKIETGGGLLYALDKINLDEPLLTLNGDVLWRDKEGLPDLNYLAENFNINKHNFLLGVKKISEYCGYDNQVGDFDFDGERLKRDFANNNRNLNLNYVYVGLQILNPQILKRSIFPQCFSVSQFYKSAVGNDFILNAVDGLELRGQYFHVGTPQNLEEANLKF